MIRFCRFSASILLFSFLAFLLVFQSAYAMLPVLAVVAALLCLVEFQRGHARLAGDDFVMLLVLLCFALVWLADVWRAGLWPVGAGGEGRWLPVWPLLAALVLLAWRYVPPAASAWWWGVVVGALCAGGIAAHEHFWLGRWRPDNGMNAIPFGNLALLLCTLSLTALVLLPHALGSRFAVLQNAVLVLAALAGLLASVLSGTRGGWVVFPALGLLVCGAAFVVMPRRRMIALAAIWWWLCWPWPFCRGRR